MLTAIYLAEFNRITCGCNGAHEKTAKPTTTTKFRSTISNTTDTFDKLVRTICFPATKWVCIVRDLCNLKFFYTNGRHRILFSINIYRMRVAAAFDCVDRKLSAEGGGKKEQDAEREKKRKKRREREREKRAWLSLFRWMGLRRCRRGLQLSMGATYSKTLSTSKTELNKNEREREKSLANKREKHQSNKSKADKQMV